MSLTVERPAYLSPRALGRTIAVFFLLTMVLGVIAQLMISGRLISFRDPARTVANIIANERLYLTGFSLFMIEMAAQVTFTVMFFHLLAPVNRRIATLALALGLVGCTIKTFSRVFYLAPVYLLSQGTLDSLGPDQVGAMTLTMLTVNDRGAGVALPFFGFETLLQGWLVMRSTFLPRWLGVLKMVSGVGWLTFLSPSLGYALFDIVAPLALVGALVVIGWLLVKGVNDERWRAVAGEAAVAR